MSFLVLDCPHCAAKNMTFTVMAGNAKPTDANIWSVLAQCGACLKPICGIFRINTPQPGKPQHQMLQYPGDIMDNSGRYTCIDIFPKAIPVDIPDAVPEAVAKSFRQAAESRKAGHLDAAASMYRKAMELALKKFSPDIEAWKIEKRIDKMAAENRITPEVQAWAHELRLDGNEALHGDGEATQEMTDQMHGLCKFLLIYLYTLPAQVAAAKARRDGSQGA